MQQEPNLVRLSELETTDLDSHINQGIDRSVGTKNNLARQDGKLQIHSDVRLQLLNYT